jgi:hypothetical protein
MEATPNRPDQLAGMPLAPPIAPVVAPPKRSHRGRNLIIIGAIILGTVWISQAQPTSTTPTGTTVSLTPQDRLNAAIDSDPADLATFCTAYSSLRDAGLSDTTIFSALEDGGAFDNFAGTGVTDQQAFDTISGRC